MINTIEIKKFLTYKPVTLQLGKYNLFIGKNGSGKSLLFKGLVGQFPHNDNNTDVIVNQDDKRFELKNMGSIPNVKYVGEDRVSTNFPSINLDIGKNYAIEDQRRPLETIWRDDEFREKINNFVVNVFDRKLIDTKTAKDGVGIFYDKNGSKIPPAHDGFGIINSVKILQMLLTSQESTIILEEPTIGFHPSITSKVLEYLVQNASDDKQFIFTSQDFVFIIEFIKLFESRDDFKIFKCEEVDDQLIISDVTELEAIATDMSDSFPTKEDMELISRIFTR